jgi:6-phosphofructokinase
MGCAAVEAMVSGAGAQMVGIVCNETVLVPLADVCSRKKEIDLDLLRVARLITG